MLDLVIPLGKGSKHNNLELLYCLRSIEKYLTNYGQLFIVGQFPDFLNSEAIHIEQPFVSGNPARNIAMNMLEACRDERLSERFLMINDDYFFTAPTDAATYPTYHKGDLSNTVRNNVTDYRKHLTTTIKHLQELGLTTTDYDVHYPTTFKKQKLKDLIERTDFYRSFGFILKSLYFNTYPTEAIQRTDCKQLQIKTLEQWQAYVKTTEVFSIADTCINPTFKDFMAETYPEKSKWEI